MKKRNADDDRILRKEKKCLEMENADTLKEFNQHQQEMIDMEEEIELVRVSAGALRTAMDDMEGELQCAQRPAMANLFERS